MGTLKPKELLNQWQVEDLTADMAVGQILQHLVRIQASLETLNRSLLGLRTDVDSLIVQIGLPPKPESQAKFSDEG